MERFLFNKGESQKNDEPKPSTSKEGSESEEDESARVKASSVKQANSKTKRKRVSTVWDYFKRSGDRKLAKCMKCGKEYKTSGNTSNLRDHIDRHHPIINRGKDLQKSIDEPVETTVDDLEGSFSNTSSARSSTRSISPFFKRAHHYDANSRRKKELDRALIEMVALDFQPFNIVKDIGFRRFTNLLDPKYVLPSTFFTLSQKMLNEFYLEMYQKVNTELNKIDYVAITCDSWTSSATESYLTVTCHYINTFFDPKSAVLSTKPLTGGINHTAENIANALTEIFEEWNIENKITCIVTDNAANMLKTCELLKKRHMPCYAHTLNLAVQENFEVIQAVIKKCKDIVTYFKSSTVAMDMFKKEQNIDTNDEVHKEYKLLQEVSTRWNSTYYMIERILKTNDAIGRAILKLRKAPNHLSVDEIALLQDSVKILKCFEEATRKVSGNNVTVSLIIPLTFGIYNYLTTILTELATEEGKIFCNRLMASVQKRLFPYETRTITKLATLLDSRFKKEAFRNKDNVASAVSLLENEMFAIERKREEINRSTTDDTDQTQLSIPKDHTSSLFAFLESRIAEKSKSITADIIITKRQYLERPNLSGETNPLLFWKISGKELPPMDECANKYLCVPATSVESERSFSAAGQIISDRRSRLKPDSVNKLIFLHKNNTL